MQISRYQQIQKQQDNGQITSDEASRKIQLIEDQRKIMDASGEIQSQNQDQVFKSILTYVISIDSLLKRTL